MADSKELTRLIEPLVQALDCELWGLEFRLHKTSALLRVFIDRTDGSVGLDDCTRVSEQLSAMLDVEDPIKVPYTLEISSPGIERPLLKPEHYQRYVGEKIKVRLTRPVHNRRNFVGSLDSVSEQAIEMTVDGEQYALPIDALDRGRLIYEDK